MSVLTTFLGAAGAGLREAASLNRDGFGDTADSLLAERRNLRSGRSTRVSPEQALRHSAVWACLRLRANLISSLPVDYFRMSGAAQIEQPKPTVLKRPGSLFIGGSRCRVDEWLYATQFDLDRYGNTFGLIVERDALQHPARIDLVPAEAVSVRVRGGVLSYSIAGKAYDALEVWHERQYVSAGLPVGLSPLAYAAMSIGQYLTAQDFAREWFGSSATPKSKLRNTKRTMTNRQAADTKRHVQDQLEDGGLLVLGSDWEWDMVNVPAATAQFLDAQRFSVADVCRFLDTPGDVIDASQAGSSVTYANLTQRNLQLLIHNLGPAIRRRELALTEWSAEPRFVKLNSDALLRMDPETRTKVLTGQIQNRTRTVTEARALDNLPPLTPEQEDEFARLFSARTEPTKSSGDDGKASS